MLGYSWTWLVEKITKWVGETIKATQRILTTSGWHREEDLWRRQKVTGF